jgi:hypothetical protein
VLTSEQQSVTAWHAGAEMHFQKQHGTMRGSNAAQHLHMHVMTSWHGSVTLKLLDRH